VPNPAIMLDSPKLLPCWHRVQYASLTILPLPAPIALDVDVPANCDQLRPRSYVLTTDRASDPTQGPEPFT